MRWTRILKYAAVLYATTFAVGFVFGFVGAFIEGASGAPLPAGLSAAIDLGLALAIFAAVSAVFGVMAYRTRRRGLAATHLVALAVWLTSFPINVVLLGQTPVAWLPQGAFLELCLLCGLGAGLGARALVGLLSEPEDGLKVSPAATAPETVAPEPAGTRG